MVTVERKPGETFNAFLRRFNKVLQQSKKLQIAKDKMFYQKPLKKSERQERAAYREKIGFLIEYLRRTGKLEKLQGKKIKLRRK